ncbi:hypothetical protein ACH5RR_034786 [Cinchona calisaya]|uniref:Uncharacterized protein n=1 Tax=Cinchona calisaya TaxID=153742 RepID=A0ABD2YFH4_9GENT
MELQFLSSLVAILNGKDRHILSDEDSTTVSLVWDINAALEPLWLELSTCLNKMENYSDSAPDLLRSPILSISGVMHPLPAGSQNILPYIESFFLMCEKLHPAEPGAGHDFNLSHKVS